MNRVLGYAERGHDGWITREDLVLAIIRDKRSKAYGLFIALGVIINVLRGLITPIAGVKTSEFMSRQLVVKLASDQTDQRELTTSLHLLLVVLDDEKNCAAIALNTVGVTTAHVKEAIQQRTFSYRRVPSR